MAMTVSPGADDDDTPMSDINTTPLVDVMLVLLIIFIITVPIAIQIIPVKLPSVRREPTTTKPENVSLSIRGGSGGECEVYWGMSRVTAEELLTRAVDRLKLYQSSGAQARGDEPPEVHIRGDVATPFRCIGGAMFTMQHAGFVKVGFISEPPPNVVAE